MEQPDGSAGLDASVRRAELRVTWRFVDGLGCTAQEGSPTDIAVLLFRNEAEEASESTPCDLGQMVIGNLTASDDYDIQVTALHGSTRLFRFEQLDIALADGEQRTITGDLLACADIPAGCN